MTNPRRTFAPAQPRTPAPAHLRTRAPSHLWVLVVFVLLASGLVVAQSRGLDPSQILMPLADSWPTYSGDYSGRRHSALTQINQSNVGRMTLAWTVRLTAGPGPMVPVPSPPFGPLAQLVGLLLAPHREIAYVLSERGKNAPAEAPAPEPAATS